MTASSPTFALALALTLADSDVIHVGRDEKNDHVRGGARIRHVFLTVFNPALDALDPASELTDDEIRTAIKNAGGITGSLLIPEAPFELLVSRAIERLLRPALQCREFVHQELVHIASQSVPSEASRFPRLRSRMIDAVEEFISQGAAPAEVRIRRTRRSAFCVHLYMYLSMCFCFVRLAHARPLVFPAALTGVLSSLGSSVPQPLFPIPPISLYPSSAGNDPQPD